MKCTIPGQNVKLFARAIHCLSRIGDELFFEALEDGLALRTVNSSRSAYACFVFTKTFLGEYEQGADQIDCTDPTELLKCKISMKSCLAIFKSLATIEKIVEYCNIIFQPDKCRLVFILHCKHGIVKTHNLTYQECESLQAVFGKELCPNAITAQSKVLQETVANFPNSCEEITVSVCPEYIKITNYVDDEPDPTKIVHTVMTLVPEEFDYFQIGIDTKVTFCLKELRAILAFSEYVNQPLSIHFEHSGKPIVFSFDSDELYVGDFVMATLSENDVLSQQPIQQGTQVNQDKRTETRALENKTKSTGNKTVPKSTGIVKKSVKENRPINNHNVERNSTKENTNSKNSISQNLNKNDKNKRTSKTPISQGHDISTVHTGTQKATRDPPNKRNTSAMNTPVDMHNPADDFFSESFPYKKGIFSSALGSGESNEQSQKHSSRTRTDKKPVKSDSSMSRTTCLNDISEVVMSDDDNEEVLVSTPPPAKKPFKSIFFSDSVDRSRRNDTTNKTIMLAADTDDEDD